MGEIINLFTDGEVVKGERKFTRLMGGFDNAESLMTTKQIAELIDYNVKVVNQTINRNINSFEKGLDIIDLKEVDSCEIIGILKLLGYTNMSISKSKNIYALSQRGYRIFIELADIKQDLCEFEKLYFGKEITKSIKPIRYEHAFGNLIIKTLANVCNFVTQFHVGNYRIDFYEPKYKLAIEYDEGHHSYQVEDDIHRQCYISNELKCKFIRVKKGDELEGLNEIFNYIIKAELEKVS